MVRLSRAGWIGKISFTDARHRDRMGNRVYLTKLDIHYNLEFKDKTPHEVDRIIKNKVASTS
jgi:hypothetical protein